MDDKSRSVKVDIAREIARQLPQFTQPPPRMEFSKKLMIAATIVYIGTWIVAVISWFLWREFPTELVIFTNIGYGMGWSAYNGKTAYENKPKIQRVWEGDDR